MATAGRNITTAKPEYRPMNRERNEFRLLRILPPSSSSSARSLDFNPAVVQCELRYYSLDDFITVRQKTDPVSKTTSVEDADETRRVDIARLSLQEHQTVNRTTDVPAVENAMSSERLTLLVRRYMLQEDRFKKLVPHDDWDSDEEEDLLGYWMKSWIWASLINEYDKEGSLTGYIALSYVWAQQPQVPDTLARQLKLYQIFQDISPTCANLMAKELPSVTKPPVGIEERAEIILDGKRISIGSNLESALRALREIPDVQAGMPVWADALCINQDDIDERNFEVKRMGSIYAHATRVISWLSEADDRHVEALEFMNVVGDYLGQLEAIDKDMASAWFATLNLHKMIQYQALLSDLPYWYRAWIVQEAVLASPSSNIICHNRRFYWQNILHFVYSFNKRRKESQSNFHLMHEYDISNPALGSKYFKFNSQVYCLHDAFGELNTRNSAPLVNSMDAWFGSLYLRLASQTNCKDSRDRVYGFICIYPGNVAKFIEPDYAPHKTLAQVMGDLAIAHIKATSALDWILLATDISPSVDAWPSWVPNIATPYKDVTLSWIVGYQAQGKRKVAEVSWGPKDSCEVPALCVKGFRLDVISGLGSNYITDMELLHQLFQSTDNLEMLLGNLQMHMGAQVRHLLPNMELESFAWIQQYIISYFIEKFKGRQSPHRSVQNGMKHRYRNKAGLQAALETCMKIIGWEPNPECKDVTTIFAIPRQTVAEAPGQETILGMQSQDFTDFRMRNEHLDFWGCSLESFFEENKLQNNSMDINSMLKLLEDMHRSKRATLFTTAGGYLGANLCRILPGDEIYLLFGCRMPVVLRKLEGVYQLIGSVYVCGAMDGEVMDELDAKGTLPEEVVIV